MPDWMTNLPDATAPAWWGAVLSTVLAAVKGWEIWRDRFRVEVGGSFTSAPDIGNEVRIRNLSPKPLILVHWEVFYGSGVWPFRKETSICERDYDAGDSTIAPVSTHTLAFVDESYFSTSYDRLKGRSVYIRLHIAGRGTIRRKLYPF